MGYHQIRQNQDMNLVLSSDAKPRLKWTPQLHQRFVEAVFQLGGAEKATPKSLMKVMAIPGLSLYHLKSHLQKYRLGRSHQPEVLHESSQENQETEVQLDGRFSPPQPQNPIKESWQIEQALEMQIDVQRKLHEQMEVQRHLQMRIEAQGKYLQTVLMKAQETLSGQGSALVSITESGCPSSLLLSESTVDIESASMTTMESSGRKKGKRLKLVAMHSNEMGADLSLIIGGNGKKRINGGGSKVCFEEQKSSSGSVKRSSAPSNVGEPWRKFLGTLDLNSQYVNDYDSGPKVIIDLN